MHSSILLAAAGFCLSAQAHLFISSPVPIPGSAPQAPLDASGSDFPCHGATLPTTGGTPMAAGSSQKLAFDDNHGTYNAVHGGGSCQLSLTYETDPAKLKDPSNWHVIYSIEGGCPSTTHGNLPLPATQCTGPDQVDCEQQFTFPIPKGVANGHAILAWTWFNTIGNREMYMNCVNAEISGGDGSEMGSFPAMFVANLASYGTCATTEETNVGFPDPGKYVTVVRPSAAPASDLYPISTASAAACKRQAAAVVATTTPAAGTGAGAATSSPTTVATTTPAAGSAASSLPTPIVVTPIPTSGLFSQLPSVIDLPPTTSSNPSSAAAATSSPSPPPTTNVPATPSPPSTLITMITGTPATTSSPAGGDATSSPASSPSTAVVATSPVAVTSPIVATSPVVASSPSAAAPTTVGSGSGAGAGSGSSSSSSSACPGTSVSCTTVNSVVCIGTTQFGLCDVNLCAVPQALAPGTACRNGAIGRRRSVVW